MGANDLIFNLRESGFSINAENSRLQIAPAKELTDELKQTIRQRKVEILCALYQEEEAKTTRRDKAVAMLEDNPGMHRAVYTDTHTDPNIVILTIAVRHAGICEMLIPKAKYDPWQLIAILENTSVLH